MNAQKKAFRIILILAGMHMALRVAVSPSFFDRLNPAGDFEIAESAMRGDRVDRSSSGTTSGLSELMALPLGPILGPADDDPYGWMTPSQLYVVTPLNSLAIGGFGFALLFFGVRAGVIPEESAVGKLATGQEATDDRVVNAAEKLTPLAGIGRRFEAAERNPLGPPLLIAVAHMVAGGLVGMMRSNELLRDIENGPMARLGEMLQLPLGAFVDDRARSDDLMLAMVSPFANSLLIGVTVYGAYLVVRTAFDRRDQG